jgi:EmrB/QacA subfamily drug resistance transporter
MGVGGAFIFPTTLSILTNTFAGQERARAIGIWAGVAGLGIVIGPLGGGLLLEHFWWGSVFLVNVPLTLTAILLGVFYVPDSRDPDESALDPIGALLSIVTLGLIMFGIIEAPDLGWGDPQVIASIGVGLLFLGVFIWWELHNDHAMLDLRFFKNPRFSAASGTITLTYFALFGSTFLLTQYFQFVLGYTPLKAGLMTAPVAIGIMGFAPQAPKFVERFGTKRVIVTGLLIVALALCFYASDTVMSSFFGGILVRIMFGAGMGLTTAPATESIMGSLPPGRAGVGSAVNDTTRQTGGALGVAVLGSIFALRYHAVIGSATGVPENVRDQVKDSIGKALEAAQRLGGAQGEAVAAIARDAFIVSMRLVYFLAAAVVLCAAFITWRFLPARAPSEIVLSDEEVEIAEAISVTDA